VYTLIYPQTVCFTKRLINKSQQYGSSAVFTLLCTFRLYVILNVLLTNHSNMESPHFLTRMYLQTVSFNNVLLTNHSNMDGPQCVHPYVPSDCMFTKCFINKSQQYGRSPLCTPVLTFRLFVLLKV